MSHQATTHTPVPDARAQKQVSRAVICFVVLAAFLIGFAAGTRDRELFAFVAPLLGAKVEAGTLDLESVQRTYQTLKENFDGELDNDKLIHGASRGLVAAAGDQHTVYMDPKEAEEFNKDLSGDVGAGIGAEIGLRNKKPTVVRVLSDHPAEKAGVQRGDIIQSVNGDSAANWDASQAANAIRGEKGTTVALTVLRGTEVKEFTITRDIISNPSVEYRVEDGVAIMKISRFDEETGSLARKAAEKAKRDNVRGVIVDLRSDGGGYLGAATEVAGLWLNNTLVATQRNDGVIVSQEKTGNRAILGDMKTIVLVDGGSASASEILAAALREHGKARLVGEKTFGKGSVQQIIDMDRSLLKVTVARWYTPHGVNVNDQGLTPDRVVSLSQEDLDKDRDPQLVAAKDEL